MLKKVLKFLIPGPIRNLIRKSLVEESIPSTINNEILKTYAQYQEDLIIYSFFDFKKDGTYIDIGAYDPDDLSNTKKFYINGWRGINVDPSNSAIKKFKNSRPEDLNINCGISQDTGELKFYELNFGALSTFNHDDALKNLTAFPGASIISENLIKCYTLEYIFQQAKKDVDFLSIDVEGYEEMVLKSNNWEKYRPSLIVIEINRNTSGLLSFLNSIGYEKVFNNHTNGIFIDSRKYSLPVN